MIILWNLWIYFLKYSEKPKISSKLFQFKKVVYINKLFFSSAIFKRIFYFHRFLPDYLIFLILKLLNGLRKLIYVFEHNIQDCCQSRIRNKSAICCAEEQHDECQSPVSCAHLLHNISLSIIEIIIPQYQFISTTVTVLNVSVINRVQI